MLANVPNDKAVGRNDCCSNDYNGQKTAIGVSCAVICKVFKRCKLCISKRQR